jgi:hypothetical protein
VEDLGYAADTEIINLMQPPHRIHVNVSKACGVMLLTPHLIRV